MHGMRTDDIGPVFDAEGARGSMIAREFQYTSILPLSIKADRVVGSIGLQATGGIMSA